MKYSNRLRRLEHRKTPVLSTEEQARRLSAFVEVETMVTGRPPTEAEIKEERQRLNQPPRRVKPEEIRAIAEEIETIITNDRP